MRTRHMDKYDRAEWFVRKNNKNKTKKEEQDRNICPNFMQSCINTLIWRCLCFWWFQRGRHGGGWDARTRTHAHKGTIFVGFRKLQSVSLCQMQVYLHKRFLGRERGSKADDCYNSFQINIQTLRITHLQHIVSSVKFSHV